MYQNFDEKYVTITYDEGSSATLTQTTLAYWDKDYGKKLLTPDEQLNMYLKPTVTPVVKYLMYDNMCKLVDVGAFIKCEKIEDALNNYKYNFYTKRNVRYTILFPVQFHNINTIYLENFEKLYLRQKDILEGNTTLEKSLKNTEERVKQEIVRETNIVETFSIDGYEEIESKPKEEVKVEMVKEVENVTLPKRESRVIFNEEDKEEVEASLEERTSVKKDDLENILSSLDLD